MAILPCFFMDDRRALGECSEAVHLQDRLMGDSEGARELVIRSQKTSCFGLISVRRVRLVLFVNEMILSLGAGMTVKFFPVFFKQEGHINPAVLQAVFASLSALTVAATLVSTRASKCAGRIQVIIPCCLVLPDSVLQKRFRIPGWASCVSQQMRVLGLEDKTTEQATSQPGRPSKEGVRKLRVLSKPSKQWCLKDCLVKLRDFCEERCEKELVGPRVSRLSSVHGVYRGCIRGPVPMARTKSCTTFQVTPLALTAQNPKPMSKRWRGVLARCMVHKRCKISSTHSRGPREGRVSLECPILEFLECPVSRCFRKSAQTQSIPSESLECPTPEDSPNPKPTMNHRP